MTRATEENRPWRSAPLHLRAVIRPIARTVVGHAPHLPAVASRVSSLTWGQTHSTGIPGRGFVCCGMRFHLLLVGTCRHHDT